jgi:TolB-like protein
MFTGEKLMQAIRNLSLALAVLFVAGCASFTGDTSPNLPRNAKWGVVPMVNYSQTPQAGERSEQILLSVLSSHGLKPRVYPASTQGEQALMDDNERLAGALDWARDQKLDYVVSGSVEEWQYKNGLDGEPAVGISLRVIEASSGRVLWSKSGARAGWSRESLAGTAQTVLDTLVGALRFE